MKTRTSIRGTRLAIAAALAAAGLAGPPAAGAGKVAVAPAGPCATAPPRDLCKQGACEAVTPVRSRFTPEDVASERVVAPAPLPNPAEFTGPGPCADPSNHCGQPTPNPTARALAPTGIVEQPPVSAPPP